MTDETLDANGDWSSNLDSKVSKRFEKALANAGALLKYAAEEGIIVPTDIVGAIVEARIKYSHDSIKKADIILFLSALTVLSTMLRPVTAASIKACESKNTWGKLKKDRWCAGSLTVCTLLLSGLAFVVSSFTSQINTDINSANGLAATLRAGITESLDTNTVRDPCGSRNIVAGPPIKGLEKITQLQTFAATSREAYKRSLKVNFFIDYKEVDPFQNHDVATDLNVRDLELNPALANYQAEILCKIKLYEDVRDFAKNVVLDNNYVYGALSLYVLPVLYSLVGAYAYRLRSFSETIRKFTYHPSFADSARMIGAFIVGSVISLFNIYGTQETTLSPLAIAFLAGYAVEVFYSLLDSIVKTVSRRDVAAPQMPHLNFTNSGAANKI